MNTKLWLLKPSKDELANPGGMFRNRRYDIATSMVVRASNRARARKLASEHCGDEGKDAWLYATHTTCEELHADGKECVIIRDYKAA